MFTEDRVIEGYEGFQLEIKGLESQVETKGPLYILFTGSDDQDGKSWCPDCVEFERLWEGMKKKGSVPEQGVLVRVKVGPRDFWKDRLCPFRTDKTLRLQSVPTLVRWGTPKRLSDDTIQKEDNVLMLMED